MYAVIAAIALILFVAFIIGANVWRLREANTMYRRPTPADSEREDEPDDRL